MAIRIEQKVSIVVYLITFFVFSLNDIMQAQDITDLSHLKNGLLHSMNISYDPFTIPDYEVKWKENKDGYSVSRIVIRKSKNDSIPGYLLIPNNIAPPYPVMICLQGHAPGMYISIGEVRLKGDSTRIKGGRDLAIQAINHGWAALVIEQKGFGEREEKGVSCNQASLRELMAGNTMTGERVKDVILAINFIETQNNLDNKTIGCIGNSTGGTISYYAAAVDPRIAISVVSCSFSTYASSWLKHDHCACGFLPGILGTGDMPEFAALIAPRKLIIVAGKNDPLADIEGVKEAFGIAQQAYIKKGATINIALIEGDGGHQFYPKLTWPLVQKLMNF